LAHAISKHQPDDHVIQRRHITGISQSAAPSSESRAGARAASLVLLGIGVGEPLAGNGQPGLDALERGAGLQSSRRPAATSCRAGSGTIAGDDRCSLHRHRDEEIEREPGSGSVELGRRDADDRERLVV
jgi:hypothetical protein